MAVEWLGGWGLWAGAALIGLGVGLLVILTGRVMSVSGKLGDLLGGPEGLAATSMSFLAGLAIAPTVLALTGAIALPPVEAGGPLLAAGGVILGIGARLGGASLCGQAICGLAPFSRRSLVAVICIVVGGVASTLFLRQVLGAGGAA